MSNDTPKYIAQFLIVHLECETSATDMFLNNDADGFICWTDYNIMWCFLLLVLLMIIMVMTVMMGAERIRLGWLGTVDKLQLFTATNDCSDNVWGWNKIELSGRRNSFVHMYRAGNHIIIHTNTQTRTQLSTRAYAPCAKFSVNFDLRFSFFSCQLS